VSGDPAGRQARAAYRGAPFVHRLHILGRWASCPFDRIAAEVPTGARVLDVGCGHGLFALYLALLDPTREVTGVDIDGDKLALARHAAATADTVVTFREGGARPLRDAPWDVITIIDVLYLLGVAEVRQLLEASAAALSPGGRLVVKELDTVPPWKLRLSRVQELLATRVLRITKGHDLVFHSADDVAAVLEGAGLEVTRTRLDRGHLHPHHLLVGIRPEAV
jgi:2-polyprenyl-3-methyl-5-hydroxy-6-metoxy-1,4-benzoquinol methylase